MWSNSFIEFVVIVASLSSALTSSSMCKHVNPQPSHCLLRGRVEGAYSELQPIIQPLIASSVQECATLCYRRQVNETLNQINDKGYCFTGNPGEDFTGDLGCDYCASFEYSPKTGFCQLWGFNITNFAVQTAHGTSLFGAPTPDCYVCPPTGCEAPYNTNLLDNSGFESPLLGPWISEAAKFSRGYKSSKSLSCIDQNAPYDCALRQSSNICPGDLYLVRFDSKTPDTKSLFEFTCNRDLDHGQNDYEYLSGNISTSWRSISAFCRAYSGVQDPRLGAPFQFLIKYYPAFSIDNIELVRIREPLKQKPGSKSLLANGDFETGRLKPWTIQGSAHWKVLSPGIHSKYAAVFMGGDGSIVQTVKTTVGVPYLLKFSLKDNNVHGFRLLVVGVGPYGSQLKSVELPFSNGLFELPYVAQLEKTAISIGFEASDGNITVDRISFRQLKVDLS